MASEKSVEDMKADLVAKVEASAQACDKWFSKLKRAFNRLEKERAKAKRAVKALAAHEAAVEKLS